MTYFPDLAPCTYGRQQTWADRTFSVGWLEPGHEYSRGPVAPEVRAKLGALIPFATGLSLGSHYCEFCLRGPSPMWAPLTVPHGSRTLSIPGRRGFYVTPELVIHYIDAHDYQPPDEFREAVMACPPGWTDEYLMALQLETPEAPFDLERIQEFTAFAICAAVANSRAEPEEARARFADYARLVMSAMEATHLDEAAVSGESGAGHGSAVERLTRAHLPLVIRICKEYDGRGVPLIELIDAGHLALSQAARSFAQSAEADFRSYAARRVRDAVEETIAAQHAGQG